MGQSIKNIKIKYYLINAVYQLSLALFSALFYVYLEKQGFSYLEINFYYVLFWIVGLLTEIPAGALSDYFGRKNSLIISIIVRSIGLFFLFWSSNTFYLFSSAVLTAIGESFKSGTLESWALDRIHQLKPQFKSDKFFSIDNIISNTVGLVGGFIGAQILGEYNLSLPFLLSPFILMFTGILVSFLMEQDGHRNIAQNDKIIDSYKNTVKEIKNGFIYIKKNKYFLRLCLSLLPLQFVMTGPASQWQLYFQNGHHNIIVGYLFVLISLSAMIGHYIAPKFSSLFKSRNRYLILTTSVNALMVFAVIFTQIYYLSIIFFLIHVVFMSSEEVTRISYLNDEIKSNNRATVLSIFNTLEALVTIAAYIIIGYIADKYSLSVSWAFSAIVMLVFAIPLFISLDKNQKKNYRGRFFHENRAK